MGTWKELMELKELTASCIAKSMGLSLEEFVNWLSVEENYNEVFASGGVKFAEYLDEKIKAKEHDVLIWILMQIFSLEEFIKLKQQSCNTLQ